jgi:hypothetical protein
MNNLWTILISVLGLLVASIVIYILFSNYGEREGCP